MKKLTFYASLLLGLCTPALAETNTTQLPPPPPTASPTQVQQQVTNKVNINTASAAELQDKLVNIGAKKAKAIVDYREKNGKFQSVEQLTEVSGIGKATLDKNRDRIVLE
ncbi:transporter [Pasteurellaceae bacterium Macca]|nr:transporter [Pasteurellaceae bacterium Macca]